MLEGTALRRMVISLLETGRHPMTVFTMSLWTRNPKPCSCLSSFPPKKTLGPSSVGVQGCSICTCPFLVLTPGVSLQLLVSLCSTTYGDVVSATNLRSCTSSILDTSVLVYGGRRGPCWPRWRPIRYGMVAGFHLMVTQRQSLTWRIPSLSSWTRSGWVRRWTLPFIWPSSSNYEDIHPVMPSWQQLFYP